MTETVHPSTQPTDPPPAEPTRRNRPPNWVIVAGIVLVIWAIALAWPDNSQPASTDSGGYTYTAAQNAPADDTALYHQYVRNDIPELADASDALVDKLGHDVCNTLQTVGLSAVAATLVNGGWNAHHAATFVGYSVATFCPDEKALLTP